MRCNARNLRISLRHLRGSRYIGKSPDSWYVHVHTYANRTVRTRSQGCTGGKTHVQQREIITITISNGVTGMELERKSKTKSGPGPYIRSQFTNLLIQFRGSRKRWISPGTGNYPIMSVGLLSNDTPCLVAIG